MNNFLCYLTDSRQHVLVSHTDVEHVNFLRHQYFFIIIILWGKFSRFLGLSVTMDNLQNSPLLPDLIFPSLIQLLIKRNRINVSSACNWITKESWNTEAWVIFIFKGRLEISSLDDNCAFEKLLARCCVRVFHNYKPKSHCAQMPFRAADSNVDSIINFFTAWMRAGRKPVFSFTNQLLAGTLNCLCLYGITSRLHALVYSCGWDNWHVWIRFRPEITR